MSLLTCLSSHTCKHNDDVNAFTSYSKGLTGLQRSLYIGDSNGSIHHHKVEKGQFVSTLSVSEGYPIVSMSKAKNDLVVAAGDI